MRYLIITGEHFVTAPRKVGLHFMADSLCKQGHEVAFLTHRLSWLSSLKPDGRWQHARGLRLNRWVEHKDGLKYFVWALPIHPISINSGFGSKISEVYFKIYPKLLPPTVKKEIANQDFIIIESGISPVLFKKLKTIAPQARFIYYDADRLEAIGVHSHIQRALQTDALNYDLVVAVAPDMLNDFPVGTRTASIPHGINKSDFDSCSTSPYTKSDQKIYLVSVGDMLFDAEIVERIAKNFPKLELHLFGAGARLKTKLPNVIEHGEQPFASVVPYIKFADIGLAPYRNEPQAGYLAQSSLKMIQYSYCKLPILAPGFAVGHRENVVPYDPAGSDEALVTAVQKALSFNRMQCRYEEVLTWEEVTTIMQSHATA